MCAIIRALTPDTTINLKEKQVELTEAGHMTIETLLKSHQLLNPEET